MPSGSMTLKLRLPLGQLSSYGFLFSEDGAINQKIDLSAEVKEKLGGKPEVFVRGIVDPDGGITLYEVLPKQGW